VLELVRGIRITEYCDQANLSTEDRLDLFMKVCHAIQHAHQKGIIHRDIKPSNILVTLHDGMPVPKVIDFGIAKATEGRLTDATVYTQLHQYGRADAGDSCRRVAGDPGHTGGTSEWEFAGAGERGQGEGRGSAK
jgi:serine/threonine protein kinase